MDSWQWWLALGTGHWALGTRLELTLTAQQASLFLDGFELANLANLGETVRLEEHGND